MPISMTHGLEVHLEFVHRALDFGLIRLLVWDRIRTHPVKQLQHRSLQCANSCNCSQSKGSDNSIRHHAKVSCCWCGCLCDATGLLVAHRKWQLDRHNTANPCCARLADHRKQFSFSACNFSKRCIQTSSLSSEVSWP